MPQLPAEVEFDEALHQYTLDGIVIPSVTQIIKAGGLYPDFSVIPADVLEWKRNLGTQVHAATELDDMDNLGDYDPQISGYIQAWREFKAVTGFTPVSIEQRIYHKQHKYAGTLDRIGIINGENVLLDIKTGPIDLTTVGPQTAAYAQACGFKGKRYAVHLGDGKYKLGLCDNKMDWQIFLNCLNLYRWKESHK